MKKLVGVAVVVLLVVGIVKLASGRGEQAKARAACENIVEQCGKLARFGGEKLTASDVDSCAADLVKGGPELGNSYEPMVTCMADADSCGEALGCLGGAFMNEVGRELGKELEGLGRGAGRMTK